jgi:cytochrome c oxidase assembly factor CtaG
MPALSRHLSAAGGAAACAVVVLPPLCRAAERLFALHMIQHLLLIGVAAPLLAYAGSGAPLRPLPVMRPLTRPVTAWTLFVGVFLFWHWAAAMRWAAEQEGTRLTEFTTLLAAGWLFWSMVLRPGLPHGAPLGARALAVATAAIVTDLPGVIMVFAPRAYCSMPDEDAAHWGLTVLEDQQIAGLLMWVPANLIFFGIAIGLCARWMSEEIPGCPEALPRPSPPYSVGGT